MVGVEFPVKWAWRRVRQQTALLVYFSFSSSSERWCSLHISDWCITKSFFSAGENGWSIPKFKKQSSVGSHNSSNVFIKLTSFYLDGSFAQCKWISIKAAGWVQCSFQHCNSKRNAKAKTSWSLLQNGKTVQYLSLLCHSHQGFSIAFLQHESLVISII